ncbi:MAG: PAS domain S-box protein [Ignavibacteria bacterium]|nr:PAS domain S-box protein [Ignavibacteria bacterium]
MKRKEIKPSGSKNKKGPSSKGLKKVKTKSRIKHGKEKKVLSPKNNAGKTTASLPMTNKRTSRVTEYSAEEKFRALSKITSDYAFSVTINADKSKTLDWITNEFKKEMGFPFQNLLNRKIWRKYFQPEEQAMILELSRSIYKNIKTAAEFRIIKSNGNVIWQRGTFKPIYDRKEKRVVKYYGTLEDITEKKKIEFDLIRLNNELEERIEEKTSLLENAVLNLKHEVSIRTAAENQIRASEKIVSDVAKNLDKKLRESEYKHLWNVFEHSEIATATIAQNGICLNYNKAAEKLFGYSHEELPNVESWLTKLVPNENYRAKVRATTYRSMEKESPSLNFEVEVTVKSGETKQLILQINRILHEGISIGVQLGQFIDISEQKKSQQTVNQIAEGISAKTGQDFFDALVENLAKAADTDFALLVLSEENNNEIMKSISVYGDGKKLENFSYKLAGTPCENVFSNELCVYASNVVNKFPHDEMLKDLSIVGYAGVPLFSSNGIPFGLLIVLSKKAIKNITLVRKLLVIFSARAATEIERQKTLDALSSSENRFRIISEQTGDLIYEFDIENDAVFRDGDIKTILGYEKEEYQKLTKEEWLKLVHPDDVAHFIENNSAAIENSKNLRFTFRFMHKEGHYIILEQSGIAIKDASGKTKRFLGRFKDITNERAREKYIELQAKLLNSASDSIILLDSILNILYVNDRACDALGYTQNELLNNNIQLISPTANEEKNILRVKQIREKNNLVFETIHRRKDGTIFPVEVNSKMIKIEGEDFVLSVNRDITERKKLEYDLKSALEKYKILFNSFPLGILVADHEGTIVESNKAFEKLFEISEEDIKTKSIDNLGRSIVKPDKSTMPTEEYASARALKEGKIIRDVVVGVVKENDEITWLSVTAAPLPTDDGGVVVAYGDITQKIVAQNALKESEERYRRLVDSSPFALFVHKGGKVLFANEACVKLFHAQDSSQVIGKNLYDYMHPDYLSIAQTRLKTVSEQNTSVPLIELKYYCMDNELIDVQTSAIPITYYGESAVLVVANDVTERNRALSKLRESEIRLRFLVERSPILIFALDRNGIFTLSEGNGLFKLGLKPGEVVGLSALEVYGYHTEIAEALKKALNGIESREVSTVGDVVFDISYTTLFDKN